MLPRWLSLLAALAAPATVAARSAPGAHGFVVDHWTTEDGLPLDHATDVAFTPDGFVWIATFEGLVRFDGARFQSIGDALASTLGTRRIAQVATHPRDGALWILAEERAVARYAGDEWRVWSADALGGSPSRWTTDSEAIWLWGTGGVLRIDETPTKLPWADNHGRSAGVAPAADGSLLFGAQEGAVFWVPPDGSPERLGAEHGLEGWPRYLDRAADGSPLLIGAEGVLRWDGSRFTPAPDDAARCLHTQRVPPFACPPRGRAASPWRVTDTAITHEGREVWRLRAAAEDAIVDPRGDLWVPTRGDGLVRVRPAALRHLSIAAPDPRINHVWLDPSDRLWARHVGVELWTVFAPEARAAGDVGLRVGGDTLRFGCALDEDRVLFLGRKTSRTFRFDGAALTREAESALSTGEHCVEGRLADGSRIVGGGDGLELLVGTTLKRLEIDLAPVRALALTAEGELAIGTRGQGLLVMDPARRVRPIAGPAGLLVDNVRHLRLAGTLLWVSTEDEGLCAVDDLSPGPVDRTWRCLRPGGAIRGVHASETDNAGQTWLATNVGLWVGASEAFDRFAAGGAPPELLHLGVDAGMAKAEANGQSCGTVVRDREGILWFPTQDGIVGADGRRFRVPAAPQVRFEPARVDDQTVSGPLSVGPAQSVHLSWTAPAPEYAEQIVYRVRLGVAPWSTPSRERGLTLAQLPPGPFQVEVQAGLAGAWGATAAISGVRLATWYEGPAPWALAALGALGLGAGVVRLRTRTLRRRQRALEAEVAARTAEVRANAAELLERTNQLAVQSTRLADLEGLRTRAIVNLHHELRTPLTLVIAGIDRLRRPAAASEAQNYERVLRNAGRLQTLMGQLADIARLEAGEVLPRTRRLDLREQVAAIVSRFEGMAAEHRLSLVPPPAGAELFAWLDPDVLDKILGNIVHNALKFTPAGGTVAVRLSADDQRLRVEIDDTGPGVPEFARHRVFERLYQVARDDDRPHEGSGVGLALARELTELCGGEIGNRPRAGGGTTFWFTLPRGAAHVLPGEVAADTEPRGEPANDPAIVGPEGAPLLLVVEDHADMRAWFAEELNEGFRVVTAVNGEQGLERATTLRPALVLSDVMMPRLDGLELARTLRGREGAPPVLLISAKVSDADRASALSVAHGWLPKPFSAAALRAEVQRLLRDSPGAPAPAPAPASAADRRLLERLAAAVDARLADEAFGVPELARAVAASDRTLQRELQRLAGVTPSRWIREHRLRRAAELLRRGEYRTVAEVAAAVGMSRAWFTRMYRAWCGRSPGEDLPGAS